MSSLFISANQIQSLVSMEDAIKAMRSAFIHLSRGDILVPKRLSLRIPDKNSIVLIMPAYAFNSPYYTVKTVSINYANPQKGLPLIHAAVQVFDASKGNLIATMDGESITAIRTGAASGLATDLLAIKDAKILAVFGAGVQARTQLEAVLAVRTIEKVLVFSRTAKNAKSFCSWIFEVFGVAAEQGRLNCLNKADIICTATTSVNSLFDHNDLKLGVHINAVGSFKPQIRELPTETVQVAKVVVDQKDACELEAGDLIIPVKEGRWSFEKIYGELGQIVDGKIRGREYTDEITLFKSVGNAIQDHALVAFILEKL